MRTVIAFVAALLLTASVAQAQTTVQFPGSVWSTNGTISPVEKNNFITMTHVEQGAALGIFEVYGQFTGQFDRFGYDWNRLSREGVGARLNFTLPKGIVRASASYLTEKRYPTDSTASGIALAVDCWFGWNLKGKK